MASYKINTAAMNLEMSSQCSRSDGVEKLMEKAI